MPQTIYLDPAYRKTMPPETGTGGSVAIVSIPNWNGRSCRSLRATSALLILFFLSSPVFAAGIDTLSNEEAVDGLKQALAQSVTVATSKLTVSNGFLGNAGVRIPLPRSLQKAEGVMRSFGMKKHADALVIAMNRTAEAAAPEAMILLVDAVRKMTVADAKGILAGDDDAATEYFRDATSGPLAEKLLPIVRKEIAQTGLLNQLNEFIRRGVKLGLVTEKEVDVENYLTQKILDGYFLMMAEEERAIRKDPIGQGNKLLQEVFGALK
ncbi:MAG: DUF4197 domain-containing protein [Pseudomonadota bacterium]